MAEPRLTSQTLSVLGAIFAEPNSSGADIARETGLPSGTLYPILLRLETAGWLTSEWEGGAPAELGRPRRRYYRVTAEGARQGRAAANEMARTVERLSWA
jgi:DNA-binding PadR family transcriptional regulator